MRRNLRFWTRYTWDTASAMLMVAAFFSAIMVLSADRLRLAEMAAAIPYFLLIAAAFCVLVINYSSQVLYVPLLISMGETRRNILFGFHYYRALVIVATVAVSALIWLLTPGELSAAGLRSIPTVLTVQVIASAAGSIVGTLYAKLKWIAVIILTLVGGCCGGIGGFLMADGEIRLMDMLKGAAVLEDLPWWLVAVAAVLLAADICFHWILLRRQEVKL